MRVFYNRSFAGHWPVGTSAVVVAVNPEAAARALEDALREANLGQVVQTHEMIELELAPQVVILQNGDY